MYITKNRFTCFWVFFVLFSCSTQKSIISEELVYGSYTNSKNKISLIIKSDKSFLFKQELLREFSIGSWKLENDVLILNCEHPKYSIDYLTSYTLKVDTVYRLKMMDSDKIRFSKKILKKKYTKPLQAPARIPSGGFNK